MILSTSHISSNNEFRVAALAVWKAVLFIRAHRFQYTIPLLCLALDFFACVGTLFFIQLNHTHIHIFILFVRVIIIIIIILERSVYFAIDPRNSRKIFDKSIELALFFLSMPFTLSVAVLITFFWYQSIYHIFYFN
jgi:hypothetical protein